MPLFAEAWHDMGQVLLDAGEFDAAAHHLRIAIALGRDGAADYANLAQAMLESKDPGRGRAVLSGMRHNNIDLSLQMLAMYCKIVALHD